MARLSASPARAPGLIPSPARTPSPHTLPPPPTAQGTVKKLLRTLEDVIEYVDKVRAGSTAADPEVAHLLQDMVAAAPRLPLAAFDKMFNSQVQDMLVVVYLANLTRTQLALAEKLQSVAAASASASASSS